MTSTSKPVRRVFIKNRQDLQTPWVDATSSIERNASSFHTRNHLDEVFFLFFFFVCLRWRRIEKRELNPEHDETHDWGNPLWALAYLPSSSTIKEAGARGTIAINNHSQNETFTPLPDAREKSWKRRGKYSRKREGKNRNCRLMELESNR